MRLATRSDREARPGGRWSSPHLVDELLYLAVLERATAHVMAGWIPKIPGIDDKLAVAACLEATMLRANAVRQHAFALNERDPAHMMVSPLWVEPLVVLDASASAAEIVDAVLGDIPAY